MLFPSQIPSEEVKGSSGRVNRRHAKRVRGDVANTKCACGTRARLLTLSSGKVTGC